ncbi:ABC transporter permease [Luteibacter yeojuensis]|uniref:Permease n=1 Tax=Luteibacter yeojuensis TaxID=345309 RepID=A0A7X5QW62_9GAMM|nr:hypothetical protein [Luteibacter yeojuensis]
MLSTVVTLAVVFAISATVLSLNGLFLYNALPYDEPGQLVDIHADIGTKDQVLQGNARGFADAWANAASFAGQFAVAASSGGRLRLASNDEYIGYGSVGPGYFRMLHASALAGRTLDELSPELWRSRVAVISHDLARRAFGEGRAVDGVIRLDGFDYRVVGVMPDDFVSPKSLAGDREDLWIPLPAAPQGAAAWNGFSNSLVLLGRLAHPSDAAAVQATLDTVTSRLTQGDAKGMLPEGTVVTPVLVPLRDAIVGDTYRGGLLMLGITACLVILGLSIVGTMLVARMAARRSVIATHMVLGARKASARWLVWAEVLILVVVSLFAAIPLNGYAVQAVKALASASLPRLSELSPGIGYLLFMALVALLSGLIAASTPLRGLGRSSLSLELAGGAKGSAGGSRFRGRAIVLGVQFFVIAGVLYLGGIVLVDSVRRLTASVGYREEGSSYVQLFLPADQRDGTSKRDVMQRLKERFVAEGAKDIANVDMPTISQALALFRVATATGANIGNFAVNGVGRSYLEAMRMKLMEGRRFDDNDFHDHADAVVLGVSAARLVGGRDSALGKRIQIDGRGYTVVGVVNDVVNPVASAPGAGLQAYLPYEYPDDVPTLAFFVFGDIAGQPEKLAGIVREVVPQAAIDANVPTKTLRLDVVREYRVKAAVCAVLVLLAILMAAAGTEAVVRYVFIGTAREIAARIAAGARIRHLVAELTSTVLKPLGVALAAFAVAAIAVVTTTTVISGIAGPLAAALGVVACASCLAVFVIVASRLAARRLIERGYLHLIHVLT